MKLWVLAMLSIACTAHAAARRSFHGQVFHPDEVNQSLVNQVLCIRAWSNHDRLHRELPTEMAAAVAQTEASKDQQERARSLVREQYLRCESIELRRRLAMCAIHLGAPQPWPIDIDFDTTGVESLERLSQRTAKTVGAGVSLLPVFANEKIVLLALCRTRPAALDALGESITLAIEVKQNVPPGVVWARGLVTLGASSIMQLCELNLLDGANVQGANVASPNEQSMLSNFVIVEKLTDVSAMADLPVAVPILSVPGRIANEQRAAIETMLLSALRERHQVRAVHVHESAARAVDVVVHCDAGQALGDTDREWIAEEVLRIAPIILPRRTFVVVNIKLTTN